VSSGHVESTDGKTMIPEESSLAPFSMNAMSLCFYPSFSFRLVFLFPPDVAFRVLAWCHPVDLLTEASICLRYGGF